MAHLLGAAALLTAVHAKAATVDLFDWAINIDGAISSGVAPAGVDLSAFDTTTGLGTVSVSLSGAGARYVALFTDHEIDETLNTFFNEGGGTGGAPAAGLSWEIDEPGFGGILGDIYTNFEASQLDNGNAVAAPTVDDVSMALAWNIVLGAGQSASIGFTLGTEQPTSGFYLAQFDPDSQAAIYFSTRLQVHDGGAVPEPASGSLAGLALLVALLAGLRRPTAAHAGRVA